jgi:hypothetical protein
MANDRNRPRPSEDVSQRVKGEQTGNERQPSAPAKTAEGGIKPGRGEPGAAGSADSERIEREQDREDRRRTH